MSRAPSRSRASGRVAAGIFLSRITGLIRERLLAHYFGTSSVADAWRAALRMPNVLQNLLGEGTLSASFIPIYSELVAEERHEEAARFAGAIFGLLTVAAGALSVLGVVAAPFLVAVFFDGFDQDRQALTVDLVRILFPMTALLVLSAWALGVLNSHRRFFLPYVAPAAWNGAIITAMVLGATVWNLSGAEHARVLALGALVGGGLQLGVQVPTALRLLREFRPSVSTAVFGVREAISNFVPVVAARGAVNLGGWLDFTLAAYLATGAVATLGYAQQLYLLPIALFGLSVAASELPELSRDRAVAAEMLGRDVARGMERASYFLIPSMLAYLALGDVITAAIFETGQFGASEVTVTWAVLAAYSVGMPASATSRLLSSGFYALRDTRTPARIAYLRVTLALGVGALLMVPFDSVSVGPQQLGAVGLALGASLAAWVELALLRRSLGKAIGPHGMGGRTLAKQLAAATVAATVAFWIGTTIPLDGPWMRALLILAPFGLLYFGLTALLGAAGPLREILAGRRA